MGTTGVGRLGTPWLYGAAGGSVGQCTPKIISGGENPTNFLLGEILVCFFLVLLGIKIM